MKQKEFFWPEDALAEMLKANALFANGRHYLEGDKPQEETVVLFVNCNDLFYWATADAEALPYDSIEDLYKFFKSDSRWGVDKWCCRQRKMKPQIPVQEKMKKEGVWEEWMDALEDPAPS